MYPIIVKMRFGDGIFQELMQGSGVAQSVTGQSLKLFIVHPHWDAIMAVRTIKEILVIDLPMELTTKINVDSVYGMDLLVAAAANDLLPTHPYLDFIGPNLKAAALDFEADEQLTAKLQQLLKTEAGTFGLIIDMISKLTGEEYLSTCEIQLRLKPFGFTLQVNVISADALVSLEAPSGLEKPHSLNDAYGVVTIEDRQLASSQKRRAELSFWREYLRKLNDLLSRF
jgi:hypothetical protein